MTLVVSDISKHGIIMIGDSAVTTTNTADGSKSVVSGAIKAQYFEELNIGISMWGYASIDTLTLDQWINQFIDKNKGKFNNADEFKTELVKRLNLEFDKQKLNYDQMKGGIHIAGYDQGLPFLHHIHRGHKNDVPGELKLYKDFPEGQGWSKNAFIKHLENNGLHLRNGYNPLFGPLFSKIRGFSFSLEKHLKINFPQDNLKSRFEMFKLLVQFIAKMLPISGLLPAVNEELSAFAFTDNGIQIDEQLYFKDLNHNIDSSYYVYF